MKFTEKNAFQNQLKKSVSEGKIDSCLFLILDPLERRSYLKRVKDYYVGHLEGAETLFFNLSEGKTEILFDHLESYSLFSGVSLVLIDEIEVLSKEEAKFLSERLSREIAGETLLLGGSSIPSGLKIPKSFIELDMRKEKPWDRKRYLTDFLVEYANRAKKRLSRNTAEFLIDRVGLDEPSLTKEIDKLICYVDDKDEIDSNCIEKLISKSKEEKFWTVAESLVWGRSTASINLQEMTDLLSLFSLVRYHLYMGLQLADQMQRGEHPHTEASFAKVSQKQLERYLPEVRRLGLNYFRRGLITIFDLELKAKDGMPSVALLLDLLQSHLDYAQRNPTYSA